jgi:hypothetical protein
VRSEQRKMREHGRDGHSANVEWGGLTAARCCETCDGRASRKIFLRGMGESYGESAKLVEPTACAQARETASDGTLDPEHYRLLGVCMLNPSIVFWRLCDDYVADGVYFARTL